MNETVVVHVPTQALTGAATGRLGAVLSSALGLPDRNVIMVRYHNPDSDIRYFVFPLGALVDVGAIEKAVAEAQE